MEKISKEEYQLLVDRATPCEIKIDRNKIQRCPVCNKSIHLNFCGHCGKALKWIK